MRDLDETDLEILQLLLSNARRPYSEIAEAVGLSAPAVSDRVERLQETGVIRRFTLDLDRSQLRDGIPVLATVSVGDEDPAEVSDVLIKEGDAEHVFTTAAGEVVAYARVTDPDVRTWLEGALPDVTYDVVDVELLAEAEWSPDLGEAAFGLSCAQCGNTVDSEGSAARIDGEVYQFCCQSCESRFRETYQRLEEGAD